MKNGIVCLFLMSVLPGVCVAASGGNLLRDDFASDNVGGFLGWSLGTSSDSNVQPVIERIATAPGEPPAVRITGRPFAACPCDFRFQAALALPLVKGTRYRLSAQVRTHGFDRRMRALRFIVAEGPWSRGQGIVQLPYDTGGKWVDVTWDGVLDQPSKNGKYVCAFYACAGAEGFLEDAWVEFRSPRLEGALAKGCDPKMMWRLPPFPVRITPVDPLLSELDADGAQMLFYSPAATDRGEKCHLRATAAGRTVTVPFGTDGRARAVFGPVAPGETELKAEMVGTESGRVYATNVYRAVVRRKIKDATPLKRLNNFVSEIFRRPYAEGDYPFTLARDGWVYVALTDLKAEVEVSFDGETVKMFPEAGKLEVMRNLSRGKHVLKLKGAAGGEVIARVVKCIYRGALHRASRLNPNFTDYYYGEEFYRAFGLFGGMNATSFNTETKDWPATGRLIDIMRERGVQINMSYGMGQCDPRREKFEDYLNYVTNQPSYVQGVDGQFDENGISLGNGSRSKVNTTEVWWRAYREKRKIDIFFYDGALSLHRYPAFDIPEISAYINSGDGRSKMLTEAYYRSPETQADFDRTVDFVKRQYKALGEMVPSAPSRYFYLFNGWMMVGGWTSWYSTKADMRAFNAEMLRIFATDPDFAEIGGAAFSTPACYEDFFRFIVAAIRYYCIDGETGSFAEKNGMSIWPTHIRNGDFIEGFSGWRAEAAEPGSLSIGMIPNLGSRWQGRQYPAVYNEPVQTRPGNRFAVFTQNARKPNVLRRKISGLEPGRVYQLTCAVSDLATVEKGMSEGTFRKTKPVNLPFLRVDVKGAEEIPELRHVFDDIGKYGRLCVFPTRVVFRAVASEAEAVFSDWNADGTPGTDAGRRTIVNYISVHPYYHADEEELEKIKMFTSRAKNMKSAATKPVDIDTGRQLFVDDFLVEKTSGIRRHWNTPVKMDSPLVWPGGGAAPKVTDGTAATNEQVNLTCATDGGLWWDPVRKRFRLWYQADWLGDICYGESKDALKWEYPDLGIVPGTNRIFEHDVIDSWCVVPNYAAENPYGDWKMHISIPYNHRDDRLWRSDDGIRFTEVALAGRSGDRSTMYYDPFRGVWVFSLRDYRKGFGRYRRYFESREFGGERCRWSWAGEPDKEPESHRGLKQPEEWLLSAIKVNERRELYSFNAVAYESLMLGVMEMLYNTPNDNRDAENIGLPKQTGLHFTFSRDGRTYEPRDVADIAPSGWGSGKWDTGYLSPVGGICVVKDEKLWFFYSGLRGDGTRVNTGKNWYRNGMYSNGAIGAATLRRDGFAGMVADGRGEVLTRPLRFSGKHLFVNAECLFGSLSAEIVGADGKAVPGFSEKDCKAFALADSTRTMLRFKGGDLSRFAGRNVRIRFYLRCGTLYSFWISPSTRGESRGYVAGGGPDYSGLRDL